MRVRWPDVVRWSYWLISDLIELQDMTRKNRKDSLQNTNGTPVDDPVSKKSRLKPLRQSGLFSSSHVDDADNFCLSNFLLSFHQQSTTCSWFISCLKEKELNKSCLTFERHWHEKEMHLLHNIMHSITSSAGTLCWSLEGFLSCYLLCRWQSLEKCFSCSDTQHDC